MCDTRVLSALLQDIDWNLTIDNILIGVLINARKCNIAKTVLTILLKTVPDDNLETVMCSEFDPHKLPIRFEDWKQYFVSCSGSVLGSNEGNNDIAFLQALFTSAQLHILSKKADSSPACRHLQNELLALCQPVLQYYVIPDHTQAMLKMCGVVCYNEFQKENDLFKHSTCLPLQLTPRIGAADEANILTESFRIIGVKMSSDIKSWSTYTLFQGLRGFCNRVQNWCSLVIVAIMTHGKAGILFGCQDGQMQCTVDTCSINDVLYILKQNLPDHVPKVSQIKLFE